MGAKGYFAATVFGAIFTMAPVFAQAQGQKAELKSPPDSYNCLLNTKTGRWAPSAMPDIRRVSGTDGGPQIRYAGRIGKVSAYVTDFRCDTIAFEVTLVGPADENLPLLLSTFRKIERGAGISNISRLSQADISQLQNKGAFHWKAGRESGEAMLEESDLSILVRALYVNKNY
jgi:hypothetical protein